MLKKKSILFTFFLFINIAQLSSLNAQNLENIKFPHTIRVSAVGVQQAQPDIAILEFGVETIGKTAGDALKNNKNTMIKTIDALKNNQIDPKDIQTSDLSIYQNFNQKENREYYHISNNVNVKIRQIQNIGKIFDEVIALGANVSRGIRFDNTNKFPYQDAAREKAVKLAIEKAKILAKAANVNLGEILSINESEENLIPLNRSIMLSNSVGSQNTPIASGSLDYNVKVDMIFAIR